MKVLLIEPPFERLKGSGATHFPIGLGYLSAILNKTNHPTKIYNAELVKKESTDTISGLLHIHNKYAASLKDNAHPVWKEVKQVLEKYKPDLVGLTVKTVKFPSAFKIAEIVKEYDKNCIIIFGGPHPTIHPEEVLKNKNVDFVIRGEGELSILELINAIQNKTDVSKIEGISYKKEDKIINNINRPLLKDLDILPFPARDSSIDIDSYPAIEMGHMVTSRGCPYNCAYCSAKTMWGRGVRQRKINEVIKEIIEIKKRYKISNFYFLDDSFTVNKQRTIELCNAFMKNKLNIKWGCSTRVDLINEEVLKAMKSAGCNKIDLGIESGSERMLKIIKKDITIKQMREAAKLLRKVGISWHAFLMIGFPEETKKDIFETIKIVKELKPSTIIFSIFTPYPGTELFNTTKELGLIEENPQWEKYSHQSPENYFSKNISKEEFREIVKLVSKEVDKYNNSLSAIIDRALTKKEFFIKHPILFIKKGVNLIKNKI